jgi:lipopolysaccharide export LptBFGC system permease protein LptF
MQFLMISLEQLVGKGLSEWLIVKLIVYNMSWMVILAVPMGVLFSTLMAFGTMSMSHEVTIIKASGGSLIRMMMPVIITAVGIYIALFWFNDKILPESNHQVKIMMNDIQRKKPTFALESGLFSTQLDGYTILARNVDSISGVLSGVTIYDMTKFQNRNIISSDSGWISFTPDYKKLVLDLKEGEVHQLLVNSVDNYKVIKFSKYRIAMNAFGFAFEQSRADMVSKGDREMNVADMSAIVDTAQANKKSLLIRVDSLMRKGVTDIISGRNLAKSDSAVTKIDSLANLSIIDTNKKVEIAVNKPKKVAKPIKTKPAKNVIEDDEEGRIIKKSIKKNEKAESGLSYQEQINLKFKKSIETGNTDLNKDTTYSDDTKANLAESIRKAKQEMDAENAKKILLEKIRTQNIEKVKSNITKVNKDSANPNINKDLATYQKINISNFDTSYPEVLNRVIQQANLIKSLIQPDVNNVTFFESRSEQYKVEIYKKYALPFACLVFVFVGCPLGVKTKGGNFGISAGISLGFYIFYWACLIGGEKLADRGLVTAWLAMWLANIVVGLVGIVLTITVNNEAFSFKSFFNFLSKK